MNRTELALFGVLGPTLSADSWSPSGIRGADKVASRYVYALMTPVGSVPGSPTFGSPFVDLARGFRSEFDVFSAFAAADPVAAASVRRSEEDDESSSEKLGYASLTGVAIADGVVTLSMSVTAADGSSPDHPIDFIADL